MSNRHIDAAWQVRLSGRQKLVLLALADHACDECGLAWPGIPRLATRTGIGATTLREDLQALTDAGLLEIRRYPRGGRGRATEYVVLGPLVPVAQTACPTCARNLAGSRAAETHQAGDGFRPAPASDTHHPGDGNGSTKATTRVMGNGVENGRVVHKLTAAGPKTHHPGGDQPSREPEPSARAHAHARERQAVAAPPRARSRPPTQPASVGDTLRSLMPGLAVSGALDAIPVGPAGAATPAGKEESQGARQSGASAGAQSCSRPGALDEAPDSGETIAWAAGVARREGSP
jgi:hypothetical protein